MKQGETIQEILLITATSFAKRQLCRTNIPEGNRSANVPYPLETSSFNTLLTELLPELNPYPLAHRSFSHKVEDRSSYLKISIGDFHASEEIHLTVDPPLLHLMQQKN